MNKTSEFETWFIAQHGHRPQPAATDVKLQAEVDRGRVAGELLAACRIYDAKFTAALSAWMAQKKESGVVR